MATKYGVTDTGFVRKRLDAILSGMVGRVEDKLGIQINQISTSVLYQLLGIIGYEAADLWTAAQDTYNAMYPNSANGVSLTSSASLAAIHPIAAEKTQLSITGYTGTEGTVVPIGTQVQDKSFYTYSSTAATTLSKTACCDIKLQLTTVVVGTTYSLSIDGTTKTYIAETDDTASAVLTALYSQFSFTDRTFTLSNNILQITLANQSSTMSVAVTNIDINSIGSPIAFTCDTYGAIDPGIGNIIIIVTNVTGLLSVNNAVAADVGRASETDTALRQRWSNSVYSQRSSAMTEAIQAAIYNNVDGVIACKVFENTKDTTGSDGRTPHSIEAVVEAGESAAIARQIWTHKGGGIETYGRVVETVVDSQGINQTIKFNRPTVVKVWLKAIITKNSEESWTSQNLTEIASYLLATGEACTMGEDVILQKFLGTIYSNLTGIAFVSLTATTGNTAGTYSSDNISISSREIAIFDATRIEVQAGE